MRPLLALALLLLLAGCGGSGGDTTGPAPSTLQITTTSAGLDADADGYFFTIDGGALTAIAASGGSVNPTVAAGTHQVVFSGIAGNCSASTPTSVSVSVAAGQSANVDLHVSCQARYSVHAGTSGPDQDAAYLVAVDAGPWHLVLANGPATALVGTAVGSHTLHIAGVAPNCALSGAAVRTIDVLDTVQDEPISVTCSTVTRKILFTSTRNGGYDLYVMHADGSAQTRITDGSVKLAHGRWSPDGSKIVCHGLNPINGIDLDIYVMNADGSGLTALTTDGNSNAYPDWSPDGSKIIWQKNYAIWVMDANGANPHVLRSSGAGPRWSPDGSQIAFSDLVSTEVIMRMDADGSNVITLQPFNSLNYGWPSWSPDGTKFLYIMGNIYTMNADASNPFNLNVLGGGDPAEYSPDGQSVVFSTYASGSIDIRKMDATGFNVVDLVTGSPDDFGPAWHP